tara:strand:- start:1837 stop:2466 length:630 start_codon:yes stop_codon:yes gene_type:complete
MALTTYALLKTTIANYLNRTDLTSYLGDFITLTESRMNRELRVREMVNTDTTTTTVAGTQSYSLPSGFLEASAVIYQSNPYRTLRFMANGDFYRQYNVTQTSGLPTFFTIVGENILLGVAPDSAQTLQIDFYKTITALSESNTTNTILTNYPELYLYGALAESSPFLMQDERLDTWARLYKEALKNANLSSEKGSITSSPMQMSATGII